MACAGKSNSLPRALSEVGPDGNARRITPHQFEAILKKEVHLSNYKKRFTYLRDPVDAASCRFYSLSASASDEVDNIVNSILAGSSYH